MYPQIMVHIESCNTLAKGDNHHNDHNGQEVMASERRIWLVLCPKCLLGLYLYTSFVLYDIHTNICGVQWVYDAWYSLITPDRDFPASIRRLLNEIFADIAQRAKRIDLRNVLIRYARFPLESVTQLMTTLCSASEVLWLFKLVTLSVCQLSKIVPFLKRLDMETVYRVRVTEDSFSLETSIGELLFVALQRHV